MQKLVSPPQEIQSSESNSINRKNSSPKNESDNSISNKDDLWFEAYLNFDSNHGELERAYYLASLCLKFKKYDDALTYVDEMVKVKDKEMSVDERNIFIGAYEFYLYEKRFSWRTIYSMESYDQKIKLIYKEIKSSCEDNIIKNCERMIYLINNYILHQTKSDEGLALMLRVKADHYRYMAEITHSQTLFKNKQNAFNFYKQAYDLSLKLDDLNPIKLSIVMNFSVFLYEILSQRVNSIFYAKKALNKALIKLKEFSDEGLMDDSLQETLTIIEIISKNLHKWYEEEEEEMNNTNSATADNTLNK